MPVKWVLVETKALDGLGRGEILKVQEDRFFDLQSLGSVWEGVSVVARTTKLTQNCAASILAFGI